MNATDNAKRIIFLDIDGVLQPGWSQERFDHNLEQTRRDIAEKFNDEAYLQLDEYDIPKSMKMMKTSKGYMIVTVCWR